MVVGAECKRKIAETEIKPDLIRKGARTTRRSLLTWSLELQESARKGLNRGKWSRQTENVQRMPDIWGNVYSYRRI